MLFYYQLTTKASKERISLIFSLGLPIEEIALKLNSFESCGHLLIRTSDSEADSESDSESHLCDLIGCITFSSARFQLHSSETSLFF